MNTNYFSKVRILDGGMGQHLLTKGLKAKGSLWSATALVYEEYHQLVVDAHLDFIKSGADVIVTNNFAARRIRMVQNKVEEHFNYANKKAGELALKAKEISKKNVLIAGSLPAQNDTYVLDQRDKNIIEKTKTMAMDWGVNNMDTGYWGGFHMLTIRDYLSNIVEYIYRNEDEKGQDND